MDQRELGPEVALGRRGREHILAIIRKGIETGSTPICLKVLLATCRSGFIPSSIPSSLYYRGLNPLLRSATI